MIDALRKLLETADGSVFDSGACADANHGNPPVLPKRKYSKGGRIPAENRLLFRRLLPVATVQFLPDSLEFLRRGLEKEPDQLKTELSMGPFDQAGGNKERLNNSNRVHTVYFQYPETLEYYFGLTPSAFSDFVCEWIGIVSDCYILRSASLDTPYRVFTVNDNLDTIHASYEEYSMDPSAGGTGENTATFNAENIVNMEALNKFYDDSDGSFA